MHRFRILVPVSLGDQSAVALKQAKRIAIQAQAMITCLHVIEKPGLMSGRQVSRETEQRFRLESELKLASLADRNLSGDDRVSYELIVTSGKVHQKILEKASELNSNMIVMGRSESRGGSRSRLGSNAARVVERSRIPVMTLGGEQARSCEHMLMAADLSAPLSLQLAKTIELAEKLNTEVTVCTIIKPGGTRQEAAYRSRLIEIKKLFDQYDILCRIKFVISGRSVVEELLSFVEKHPPDLLILMTRQETEPGDLSLGSVAGELIRKSRLPVLSLSPLVQNDPYPYRSLFGAINKPVTRYDLNDQLITST